MIYIFVFLFFALPTTLFAASPFKHNFLDQILQKHVYDDGLVHYGALAQDRSLLDAYIDSLANYSPTSHPDRFPETDDSLAYWINAYNAFVLRGVIDAYPIASVKDAFLFSGFFNRQKFIAGGLELTLDYIENRIIRPKFRDPRIHFAVNCGARSCPQLEKRAYTGNNLDSMLERSLERFARDPQHVQLQGRRLTLSKILDWYGKDFINWFPSDRANPEDKPPIVNYLLPYLPPATASQIVQSEDIELDYFDYDWTLNEAIEKGPPQPPEDSP